MEFTPVPLPDEGGLLLNTRSTPCIQWEPPEGRWSNSRRHRCRRCSRRHRPTSSLPRGAAGEAGSLWRSEKLRDFVFRLRCLGLENDPQFVALAAQIAEETAALEKLAEVQKAPDYERPWWQDGEYDSARADRQAGWWGGVGAGQPCWRPACLGLQQAVDLARPLPGPNHPRCCPPIPTPHLAPRRANDRGMELFEAGQHSAAFDCFTEAIRLCPTSPVYHCNRAAAALKLGRPGIAAEDAAAAVQRDPGYLRAHLRLGRAHMQLQQPAEAEAAFRRALELDGACAAASKALVEAAALTRRQWQQADEEAQAARAGSRPGLTREEMPEEEAVSQLYAAEQMLAAQPKLQVGILNRWTGQPVVGWEW